MSTATKKPKKHTLESEFARREQQRVQAQAEARTARDQMEAYEVETEELRYQITERTHTHADEFEGAEKKVRPKTKAAELQAEIRRRMREPNPHEAGYEDARDAYGQVDGDLKHWLEETYRERIAEYDPIHERASAMYREAAELILRAGDVYRDGEGRVHAAILATPGRNGQDFVTDERVRELDNLGRSLLEDGITPPHAKPDLAMGVGDFGV